MIYEATTTHIVIDDNGNDKLVKGNYIIDYVETFSDVEQLLFNTLEPSHSNFDVTAIKRSKLREVIDKREDADESIFVADIADTQTNDDGEELEIVYKIALHADNIDSAYAKLKEYLKQGYSMTIVAIKKTKIVDVL